jgi:hypothetical protein
MSPEFYEDAVELGFGRFTSSETNSALAAAGVCHARADEPLALLGGVSWLTGEESTRALFVDDALRMHPGEGFELVVAHYLTIAFGQLTPLSKVFDFAEGLEPRWTHARGRLVAANALGGGKFEFADVDFGGEDRAVLACLGYRSRDRDATLKWLKDPGYTAFCFPDANMGPDMCFYLRLEDGEVISVFVQAKGAINYIEPLPLAVYRDAAKTVAPENVHHNKRKVTSSSDTMYEDPLT